MILLVEDDQLVRELLQSFLEIAGYRATEAATAEDALRLADSMPGLQLLVTDLDLPGIDGTALAMRLRARWPDLRVLYMSGNAMDDTHVLDPRSSFITKPFSRERLLTSVRDLLSSEP